MTDTTTISDGMIVSMHYTLKHPEGHVIDTSDGDDPLEYLHGAQNIVPGLEKELAGRSVGDKLNAVIAPEDGYGERGGPEPQPVPRSQFPQDREPHVGMQIIAESPDGKSFPLWIVGVDEAEVTVDHNHPLAGVTLHFDVEITAVRAASAEEIAHGHPHGPGGHNH